MIILELIPTALDPLKGDIIQLSALKIEGEDIVDRFDYRLKDEFVPNESFLDIISYNKDSFIYKSTTEEILSDFKLFSLDDTLLILDNGYTKAYLAKLNNKKENILDYLNLKYSDDIIEKIIKKYKLIYNESLVDLLYLAYIKEKAN